MRNLYKIVIVLCLVLSLISCNSVVDNNQHEGNENGNKEISGDGFCSVFPKYNSVEEFKQAYKDIPHSTLHKAYIDFNSIIPNEEVLEIIPGLEHGGEDVDENATQYQIEYKSDSEEKEGLYMIIGYGKEYFTNRYFTPEKKDILSEGKTYTTLKDVPEGAFESFVCNVDGVCVLYSYHNEKIDSIRFMIDEHYFNIYAFRSASPAQEEFISAFLPSLGATDNSITAMLDRIKALIPSGNTSEDDTQDEVNREVSGATFSNDGSSTTDQTAGETNEDTNDGDDYLYDDNEFPTIPGISPDWKPNANGKYPLKDGYTKYELTLILACDIELDFGDMTDEEISKLEFRLIEEDTEG